VGFKYRAFISYSWKDKAEAEALHRKLEAFRAPTALKERAGERLVPIFRDRDEEAAGASLKAAIEEALDNSEFLIIVCSPNASASPWVAKEVAYFRRNRTAANILSYVIAGEPGASLKGAAGECFPPTLLYDSDVEGNLTPTPIEAPLAADARDEGDGPRLARLKIIAAMLGVGLDDLVRRDDQRRTRRLRAWLAGMSAAAAALVGVAAYAVVQRNAAVASAARAKRESLKAERTAEFMVRLFEVPDPSESRGREVTAREILDKGVKTIERDLADEPDVQASLMHTMGRTYIGLGLYPDAARILGVARQKRVATSANPKDLYATENALARALFEKGDLDAAKEIYAKLIAEAEADIKKGGWRADYAVVMTGMGETVLYADDAKKAQPYYVRARDLLEAHGMGESVEMAEALQGLGGALVELAEYSLAEVSLNEALRRFEAAGMQFKSRSISARNDLAYAIYRSGNIKEAANIASIVLSENSLLLGPHHPETVISRNNLARYRYEGGDLGTARHDINSVIAEFENGDREQHFDFAFPLNTAGEIANEQSRHADALGFLNRAKSLAVDNSNRIYGPIDVNLGRAICEMGRLEMGLDHIAIGRNSLSKHYSPTDWRYGVADEFESRCRAAMGERKKARALATSGYARLREQLGDEHYFTKRAKAWMEGLRKEG
jgi:tetratricopeptide (TPR) repeat protein